MLEREGYEVRILDALAAGDSWYRYARDGRVANRWGLTDMGIDIEVDLFKPDLVGVTCPFSAREWDTLNVCRIAKQVNPKIVTVVGGAHPTCVPQKIIAHECVDNVVLGEGERSFLHLVQCYNDKSRWIVPKGILQKALPIKELDTLPFPARHLLPMDKYINSDSPHSGYKRKPYTSIITSRGCPNRCTFCVIRKIWGPKIRFRSPENVLAEIDHLIKTYNIREVHFEDDNFLANRRRAETILRGIIEREYDLSLNSPSGLAVYTLDSDLLQLMVKAGYYSISLAIESGVSATLRRMRKPVNLKEVPDLVKRIREMGMLAKAFFILGYPGETKDDMLRTVDFAASLDLDWAIFFRFTPIPGSDAEQLCRKNGWLLDSAVDPQRSFYQSVIKTPEFGPEDVEQIWEYANRRVNFEENTNMREGNYDRAIKDFEAVVKHYPHLDFAKEALSEAREKISEASNKGSR